MALATAFFPPNFVPALGAFHSVFVTTAPRLRAFLNAAGTPEIDSNAENPVHLPVWDTKERFDILLLGVDRDPDRGA